MDGSRRETPGAGPALDSGSTPERFGSVTHAPMSCWRTPTGSTNDVSDRGRVCDGRPSQGLLGVNQQHLFR